MVNCSLNMFFAMYTDGAHTKVHDLCGQCRKAIADIPASERALLLKYLLPRQAPFRAINGGDHALQTSPNTLRMPSIACIPVGSSLLSPSYRSPHLGAFFIDRTLVQSCGLGWRVKNEGQHAVT